MAVDWKILGRSDSVGRMRGEPIHNLDPKEIVRAVDLIVGVMQANNVSETVGQAAMLALIESQRKQGIQVTLCISEPPQGLN